MSNTYIYRIHFIWKYKELYKRNTFYIYIKRVQTIFTLLETNNEFYAPRHERQAETSGRHFDSRKLCGTPVSPLPLQVWHSSDHSKCMLVNSCPLHDKALLKDLSGATQIWDVHHWCPIRKNQSARKSKELLAISNILLFVLTKRLNS